MRIHGLFAIRGCRRYPIFKSAIYFYTNIDYDISER